MMGYSN